MDWIDWARGLFGLIATLAMIAGAALLARRFGMITPRPAGQVRRLRVQESLMLDPRRRLVLIRADDREHLVLLSATGETLLSSSVALASAPATPPAPAAQP
jgi:flagellar protein FliO/FliZ